MNIYYINNNYPENRCVIDKVPECSYIPLASASVVYSIKAVIEKIQHAFAHRYSQYLGEKTLSCYWLLKRRGIIHTFNSCISGKNKWCATFETVLPRTNYTRTGMSDISAIDKWTLKQFKLLAKDNCLGCMALSQATYERQMSALEAIKDFMTNEEIECIRNKTHILHPPQELLVTQDEIVNKFDSCDVLELIFVGHDFFRKGGKELVDCLLEYKKQSNANESYLCVADRKIHLTVVSCMNYGDYASHATETEMLQYKSLLENELWITFFEKLSNDKVLELCKKAHIGLLPTFADTYGYSVLEMQACGCAMLTTDIRSLPEINNESCGWICHLPQNNKKEALYQTEEMRVRLKKLLSEELQTQLHLILNSTKEELLQKALNSWSRVKEQHNPDNYSKKLKEIWNQK